MPRYNIQRISSGGASVTEKKFGASAGASYAAESGVGIGVALDMQRADAGAGDVSKLGFSVGVFYRLN